MKKTSRRITDSQALTRHLREAFPQLRIWAIVYPREQYRFVIKVDEKQSPSWAHVRREVARWFKAAYGVPVKFGKPFRSAR